jgi:hypothetical protein
VRQRCIQLTEAPRVRLASAVFGERFGLTRQVLDTELPEAPGLPHHHERVPERARFKQFGSATQRRLLGERQHTAWLPRGGRLPHNPTVLFVGTLSDRTHQNERARGARVLQRPRDAAAKDGVILDIVIGR